jgi:capsular polysaccharide transport system ATP-binding protein
MIRLEGVSKSYKVPQGRHVILDDVTFTVPDRCRLGIFGANGVGKSALLRIIAGGEMPDSGRIVRDGRVSFPVGFTGTFHPLLSARENVSFLAHVYGMHRDEVVEWIESFAELGRYFDMPVGTYSSGMYARIAFATSFAFDFDVYLVDEVIEVGDARFRRKCAAAFEERMKTASLILVSQHVSTIRQFCNLAAVLHEGKLSDIVPVDEALGLYEHHLRLMSLPGVGDG